MMFKCFEFSSLSSLASALSSWNMTKGVTEISQLVYQLHMQIFWICVGIGVIVFSLMLWAILFHRKSLGHQAATFHESLLVEVIWTIIPFCILVAMAIPTTKILIRMEDTSAPDITIKVVGYQWFWEYDYLNEGFKYQSYLATPQEQINNTVQKGVNYLEEVDYPIVVPVDKKIRFLTASADVQHSFWVPALGFKKDCIPGFINEAWTNIKTPGIYRGKCAELCGARHGYMPIEIHAVTWDEYQAWIAKMKKDFPSH